VKSLEFSRYMGAPPATAWEVVSDVAGFGEVAPNLSRAEVLAGAGEGMRRRCYDSRGRGWEEDCTLWEEGRSYEMRVRTETYPFVLRKMFRGFRGRWEVEPQEGGTIVTMRYEVEPSRLGKMLWFAIGRVFERQCELLLDNWQREIESRVPAATH
jgi:ribosome-associated toxin RatA of RatAB toxin-antitoxin module